MNLVIIFLAKYLIYLLAAWTIVSGWFLRKETFRSYALWLLKLGLASLLVAVATQLINMVFPTPRPFVVTGVEPLIPHAADPSFPSSHAAQAALLASFIWRLRRSWGLAAFVLVLLVGAGRVLAGVHYPQDVAGGVILGTAAAALVFKFWPRNWD